MCEYKKPAANPIVERSSIHLMPHMPDFSIPLCGHARIREYEIQELVGSGGFGFVYRATDQTLRREVAIKEYFPKFIAMRDGGGVVRARLSLHDRAFRQGLNNFLGEARALAQFDDPAIVKVHRFWEQNGTAYMVMPFYEGITLRRLVRHHRELISADWLTAFLQRVMGALESLHGGGLCHRDLSPENILILKTGGMVLLDFGSSQRQTAEVAGSQEVILKPGYAPIEQYLNDEMLRQGPWTDLYGLGAVLHFLLEGQAPQAALDRVQRDAYEALRNKQDSYPEMPAAFLAAVDRCLAVQPDDRPQSIAEFRQLLALDADHPGPNLDLYRGVKKALKYPATSTVAIGEEDDLTVPLDPGSVLPATLSSLPSVQTEALPPHGDSKSESGSAVPQTLEAAPGGSGPHPAIKEQIGTADQKHPHPDSALSGRRITWRIASLAVISICAMAWASYLLFFPPLKKEKFAAAHRATPTAQMVRDEKASPNSEARTPAEPGTASVPVPAPTDAAKLQFQSLHLGATRPVSTETQARPVTPAHKPSASELIAPAPQAKGVLRLNVKPWGKLLINGQARGATPPLKQLKLPPGKCQIEISNPGFPSFKAELEVSAGKLRVVKHIFE